MGTALDSNEPPKPLLGETWKASAKAADQNRILGFMIWLD